MDKFSHIFCQRIRKFLPPIGGEMEIIMKRKNQPLTCTFYVGGKQVQKLTPEQCEAVAQRFSEVVSRYYSLHPEEYLKLKDVDLTKA